MRSADRATSRGSALAGVPAARVPNVARGGSASSLSLLPSMHEVTLDPIHASYVKGLQSHRPTGEMQPPRYIILVGQVT
jgi:hypothetical protein